VLASATEHAWETCRGVGLSFGYNRQESEIQTLSARDLVWLLVDVVSKNGNLLLGVGPTETGAISDVQRASLAGLGRWLRRNGDAIYGTRPWLRHAASTGDGRDVRFTTKDNALYAVVAAGAGPALIEGLQLDEGSRVELLGGGPASWRPEGGGTLVDGAFAPDEASAIRITPAPR
jgi:alpha-L-fucosidase